MNFSASRETMQALKTFWMVRAAQGYRVLREFIPGAGLPLAACIGWARQRRKPKPPAPTVEPHTIVVIRLDAMGDLILTTPVFRELKRCYPEARITAVVQRGNHAIIETSPFVNRVLVLDPVSRSMLFAGARRSLSVLRLYAKSLRGRQFDIALQPRLGPDYFAANLLLTLVDASLRIKYEDALKRGLSRRLASLAYSSFTNLLRPGAQHEIASNAGCVRRVTGRDFETRPELFLTREDRWFAQRFLAGTEVQSTVQSTLLCLAFGAQARRRQWPVERWAETVQILARKRTLAVVICCSGAETAEAERLRLLLDPVAGVESRILSGAGLRQVAGCMEGCDLFLGADSGLAHLAAAAGCATLVVSAHPSDGDPQHENSPLRFRPYSQRAAVMQPATARAPCQAGCDAVEPHCILEVRASDVAQSAEEALLAARTRPRRAEKRSKISIPEDVLLHGKRDASAGQFTNIYEGTSG